MRANVPHGTLDSESGQTPLPGGRRRGSPPPSARPRAAEARSGPRSDLHTSGHSCRSESRTTGRSWCARDAWACKQRGVPRRRKLTHPLRDREHPGPHKGGGRQSGCGSGAWRAADLPWPQDRERSNRQPCRLSQSIVGAVGLQPQSSGRARQQADLATAHPCPRGAAATGRGAAAPCASRGMRGALTSRAAEAEQIERRPRQFIRG